MKTFKRFMAMLFCISLLGFGLALILKASIGAGPYDAVSQTLSNITNIKVGTITTLLNGFFVLSQIVLKGRKFPVIQYLQIIVIFLFGYVVNFFLYDVLVYNLNNYFLRILLYFIGTVFTAIAVAGIMNINVVYTALEGFLITITEKTNSDFVRNRLFFDIFCVVLTLVLSFTFKVDMIIREGTILSALIFAPIMGFFMEKTKPLLRKFDLLEEGNLDK